MDYEKRAAWIRRLVLLLLAVIAVVIGFQVDFFAAADPEAEDTAVEGSGEKPQMDEFDLMIGRADTLTVVNIMHDGNPGAEGFAQILRDIQKEKVFPSQVDFVQYDVGGYEKLAQQQKINLDTFKGRLDFYADGKRLGFLVGPSDREKVEETITYYLKGLLKKYGKGWRPDVPGMETK